MKFGSFDFEVIPNIFFTTLNLMLILINEYIRLRETKSKFSLII
jgi:hypothetical protein